MSIYTESQNEYITRIINLIKNDKKPSGRILNLITLSNEQIDFCGENNTTLYCYMIAKNISERPKCIVCGTITKFHNTKVGFRKFCSVKCSTTFNNSNTIDNLQQSFKNICLEKDKLFTPLVEDAIEYYKNNNITIKETADLFQVPHGRLRKTLSNRKIIKENFSRTNKSFLETVDKRLFCKDYLQQAADNKLSLKEIAIELGIAANTVRLYALKHSIKFSSQKSGGSFGERDICSFLDLYNIKYIKHDREILNGRELDIYLPDHNIAIEYNGIYWHSKKDRLYHYNKTVNAAYKNIDLIQIYDYEWNNKKDLMISYLKSKLGIIETKIYARKCFIKRIGSIEGRNFFQENHIQGASRSKYYYGLFHDDNMMSCISFCKPRFNLNYDYELVRFANKKDILVVGGFQKLVNAFREDHKGSIITYANRRLFSGNAYRKAGFVNIHNTKPGYVWTDGLNIIPRYKTQKTKLLKLDNSFVNMSESEIMMKSGFHKLWDCGQSVFVLE